MTNSAASQPAIAPEPAPARGFPGLRCPACGTEDSINLCLDNGQLWCKENECEFEREDVEAQIAKWKRVLAFLALMPVIE